MDADFYVFSGHKLYGPTGTGVLYGKEKYLEEMAPGRAGEIWIMGRLPAHRNHLCPASPQI